MKKNALACLLVFLCLAKSFSQPTNINISNTSLFEGEPYMAINPVNPKNIVIAWMALDASTGFRTSIKSKVSFDGGVTWGNSFVQPHMGVAWHSADVSMQFRRNGTVYLNYIDYQQSPDSGGVYITHSTDGGVSWSAPTRSWNILTDDPSKVPLDRPWIAVDNSGTSNDGVCYVTTKPAPWILPPNRPYLKISSDSGATWTAFRYVDTLGTLVGNLISAPMAFPNTTADGALVIAYPSYLASQSVYAKYYLAKSYTRGASFQYYDLLVSPVAVTDTNYKTGYHLATNPSNANQMAFVFVDNRLGDADIYASTSSNGGLNWTNPIRVNDDANGNGKGQDLPWISYDKNNHLLASWRDRRNGSGSGFAQACDTYCSVSFDNGLSFHPNIRLSDATAAYDTLLAQNGNDFMCSDLLNDTIYSVWSDVRSGNLNVYFAKISDSTGTSAGLVLVDKQVTDIFSLKSNCVSNEICVRWNLEEANSLSLVLFDGRGKEVLKSEKLHSSSQTFLDVSSLPSGIYFLSARLNTNPVFTKKVLISK